MILTVLACQFSQGAPSMAQQHGTENAYDPHMRGLQCGSQAPSTSGALHDKGPSNSIRYFSDGYALVRYRSVIWKSGDREGMTCQYMY
ncbi:hypothetical protein VTH82DRAFT_4396 [Thermothelomyces myriococcoides]